MTVVGSTSAPSMSALLDEVYSVAAPAQDLGELVRIHPSTSGRVQNPDDKMRLRIPTKDLTLAT